jgi:hypothetical protein
MFPLARRFAMLLLAWSALPPAASAQQPASSLTDVQQWVRIGDRVTVTDAGGRRLTGSVAGLKWDTITLAAGSGVRDFAQADVLTITRREADSLQNGALIGLGIGGGLFLVAVVSSGGCAYESDCGAMILIGTAFYAAVGAGIGVGIDALIPGRETVIFRRPAGRATVGFSPHLAPRRQAVVFSVTF